MTNTCLVILERIDNSSLVSVSHVQTYDVDLLGRAASRVGSAPLSHPENKRLPISRHILILPQSAAVRCMLWQQMCLNCIDVCSSCRPDQRSTSNHGAAMAIPGGYRPCSPAAVQEAQIVVVKDYDDNYNYDDNDYNDHCDELQAGARPLREVGPSGDPNKPSKRTHTHTHTHIHAQSHTNAHTHTHPHTCTQSRRISCEDNTFHVLGAH